ncbi:MAG: LysM peptidoglycan-binding domain-containing protein [Muribaculum sp.]|nr:LysM peptidoglycan-binding domain-containing protein [Muribaculum sp.]
MNCRKLILRFMSGLVALGLPVLASAITLPIKKINGADYYYYEVKPKETVFGLCRQLNLTKAEIVKYNPSVADGLRAGTVLVFPVELIDGKSESTNTYVGISSNDSDDNVENRRIPVSHAASHHVKKGETVYGICRHYGISEDDLIALNPSIKSGALKQGTILLLPDGSAPVSAEVGDDVSASDQPITSTSLTPSVPSSVAINSTASTSSSETLDRPYFGDTDEVAEILGLDLAESEKSDTLRISVMLPFMLSQQQPDKQAQFYTEFYKGFLMAVDSLRNESLPLVVDVYDTAGNIDSVYAILRRPEVKKSNLILAPDGDEELSAIAQFGKMNRINVMNIFAVRNTDYKSNPYLLQSNIPHSDMYDRAVDGVIDEFPGHTFVFLSSLDGKSDKQEFVSRLRSKAERVGHPFVDVSYHGYLKSTDLENLSDDIEYLFVPASGAHSEYNHIISTLKSFKESRDDYNKAVLFGYPEWITFPAEAVENMHFMNSTIYSRFYNDAASMRSKDFSRNFQKWYSTPLLNAIPVQGILGFDSGFYIVKALNDNARRNSDFSYDYDGIQSGFHFVQPLGSAGMMNDSLYFINFRPSGIVDKKSVE